MSKAMYFAKNGETFGPYTPEEVAALKKSGEYETFKWVWDEATDGWAPLEQAPKARPKGPTAPPPMDDAPMEQHQVIQHPAARAVPTPKPVKHKKVDMEAVFHDSRSLVHGALHGMNEEGGEIYAQEVSPSITAETTVVLHLNNPKSGKQVNMEARITHVSRAERGWLYQLVWAQAPAI